MKFHHVGVACQNIIEGIEFLRKTHRINSISKIIADQNQQAEVCMVNVEDDLNIELISGHQVAGILRRGISIYHTCYEVDDLDESISTFCNAGCIMTSPPMEAVLFGNRRVVFVQSSFGIIELLEATIRTESK